MSEVENTRTVNPNATSGAGRGYDPVRLGARAIAEETRYNKTVVKITQRVDPVVGGGVGVEGAFFTMRTSTEEATVGNIYLQGGMVTAGTGNKTVADILLYDAPTPPATEGTWGGTPGQILILVVDGNGQETSGILDPVFNTTTGTLDATIDTSPAPANNLPEHGSLDGSCVLMLGVFYEGGFSPSYPGNFNITFCYGGFTISRT